MGNCCSDVGGGMTAIGGTAPSTSTSNQNDAADWYFKSHGIHGIFSQIELSFSATNLRDRDVFSKEIRLRSGKWGVEGKKSHCMEKSDPMVVVYIQERDGAFTEVFRTEVVLNSLNPTWITKYTITYQFEIVQILLFRVFDVDTQFHNVEVKVYLINATFSCPSSSLCLLKQFSLENDKLDGYILYLF
ncbi:protein BONZAI 1-like isoform X1 [Gossypium australe]|uniref:Protein BONZAI 1-like isoform X1 n=1 Tax=Gossypium australe TaxID=47621 RepID=A0A5B6W3D2_9ROSI|nr:protein BONZAI 1-like isoform X1 [Gossypium australe]